MTDTPEPQAPALPASAPESSHPLDSVIASIRTAVATDASPEARAIGVTACRSIMAALEGKAGEPLGAPRPTATPPPASPTSPIAMLLSQFASMPRDKMFEALKQLATSPSSPLGGILAQLAEMPRDQLVQLINQKLRGIAPAGTPVSPPSGPRFHLISIPPLPHRRGA
jgi:hypothetical protein